LERLLDLRRAISDAEAELLDRIVGAAAHGFAGDPAPGLAVRLRGLAGDITSQQREALDQVVILAAAALAPRSGSIPIDPLSAVAFKTIQLYLAAGRKRTGFWHTRPSFVTDELLRKLQAEARARRRKATRPNTYFVSAPGPVASGLVLSKEVSQFIADRLGDHRPSGFATYLYYEQPGDCIGVHVDVEEFSVNLLLCIAHEVPGPSPSRLIVYEVEAEPRELVLAPGEVVLFQAKHILHTRTPICPGEKVCMLSTGFRMNS
jgi:hypothetical protein